MKKIKDVLYDISVKITSAALIILFVALCLSGAVWSVTLLLRLIGVI